MDNNVFAQLLQSIRDENEPIKAIHALADLMAAREARYQEARISIMEERKIQEQNITQLIADLECRMSKDNDERDVQIAANRHALFGNGSPEHSAMTRLKNLEDSMSTIEKLSWSVLITTITWIVLGLLNII